MSELANFYALGNLRPTLPKNGDFWVAPDARIIGQITLQSECSVWWGSILRGVNEPIVVGAGSNLQEQCVCHVDPGFPLIIGKNCTIGHKAMLHGCKIGDGSLVVMGAIILNSAKIGKNCLIGASALVTEGMEMPDGSLVVGALAKIKRAPSEDAIKRLANSSKKYQLNKDRFKAILTPIFATTEGV